MSTYQVETDNGTYQVETEDAPTATDKAALQTADPAHVPTTPAHWQKQGDYPKAGAEIPPEQHLLNNTMAAAQGFTLPSGIASLAKLPLAAAGKLLPKTVTETVGDLANDQLIKSLGGSMRNLPEGGAADLREAADVGRKANLDKVFSTSRGRQASLDALKDVHGKEIGTLREAAGPADSPILNEVANDPKLEKYLGEGLHGGQLGQVDKALKTAQEVAGPTPTHAGLAKAATEINDFASNNKLFQSDKPASEVANLISSKNNPEIARKLGSVKAKEYVDALKDESGLFKLKKLMTKGENKEVTAPGNILSQVLHSIGKAGGNRAGAKVGNAIYEGLNAPTELGKTAAQLTPNAVAEWISSQNQPQTLNQGGEVKQAPINDISDEIKAWVSGKVNDYRKSDFGDLKGLHQALQKQQDDPANGTTAKKEDDETDLEDGESETL